MDVCWAWQKGCAVNLAEWLGAIGNIGVLFLTFWLAWRANADTRNLRVETDRRANLYAASSCSMALELMEPIRAYLSDGDDKTPGTTDWREIYGTCETAMHAISLAHARDIPDPGLHSVHMNTLVLLNALMLKIRQHIGTLAPLTSQAMAKSELGQLFDQVELLTKAGKRLSLPVRGEP